VIEGFNFEMQWLDHACQVMIKEWCCTLSDGRYWKM